MVKLGLFAAMLTLGAINFLSTKPAVRDMAHSNVINNSLVDKAIKRIAVESMLGLAIFATTGYLTVLPRGCTPCTRSGTATGVATAQGASVKRSNRLKGRA